MSTTSSHLALPTSSKFLTETDGTAAPLARDTTKAPTGACPYATPAPRSAEPAAEARHGSPADLDSLPPIPRPSLSRWTQTVRFLRDPFPLLSEARAECGDLFVLDLLGMGEMAFVCSAQLLHEIYKKPEDEVVAGEMRARFLEPLTGTRVSTNIDGAEYARRRRVTAPHLTGRRVGRHARLIQKITEESMDRWPEGEPFQLQPHLDDISRRVICRVLFGPLEAPGGEELLELSRRFLEAFQWPSVQMPLLQRHLGPWSPWSRYQRRRHALLDALRERIRVRQSRPAAEGEHDDMMSALVDADLHDDPDEQREIVAEELLGMLIGGAETTAKALAWAILGTVSTPGVVERLRHELDAHLGDRPIETGDLPQLPYLDAVVKEGIRYQSVGPFAGPRLAKKPFALGGYRVDAGTPLVQALSEVGRGDGLFPNPHRFDPDNFFGRDVKPQDWVPFGGGKRTCTGMGLAQLELALVVATVVRRADLELGRGSTKPVKAGIAYQPKNGLRVELAGRRRPPAAAAAPATATETAEAAGCPFHRAAVGG